jgi:hypothetical protein
MPKGNPPQEHYEAQLREALGLGADFEGGWPELLEVVRNDYRQLRAARKALEI